MNMYLLQELMNLEIKLNELLREYGLDIVDVDVYDYEEMEAPDE